MTKVELIEKVVARGISRSAAMEVVDNVITVMAQTLSMGESITLRGLGTFKVRTIARKVARNLNEGTTLIVPAHKNVKFILSNKIKNLLKNA